ncbi:hypothetical protein [Rhodopseudomonas palustris]|uniref:hypothetical protein n=1 Tax=Rhodopseudomonas palustris TaxID=1076 RepID=UPI0015CF9F8A|nr:hypothetical protein [Rhodopseudomonas palustris]QLH72817.1 hypothetical protein HZF03_19245 [Rhodopseudomonas palustris]
MATMLLATLLPVLTLTVRILTVRILLLLARTGTAALLLLAGGRLARSRLLLILIRHRWSPSECRAHTNNNEHAPAVARIGVIFARLLRGNIASRGTARTVHREEGCNQSLLPRSRPTVRKLRSEATFRLPGPSPHRVCNASAISAAGPFGSQSTTLRVPLFRVL